MPATAEVFYVVLWLCGKTDLSTGYWNAKTKKSRVAALHFPQLFELQSEKTGFNDVEFVIIFRPAGVQLSYLTWLKSFLSLVRETRNKG